MKLAALALVLLLAACGKKQAPANATPPAAEPPAATEPAADPAAPGGGDGATEPAPTGADPDEGGESK